MANCKKLVLPGGQTRYVVDYYDLDRKRRKERFRTYREAQDRLGQILRDQQTGELRPRVQDLTFRELVDEFRLSRFPEIRENTRTDYVHGLDHYLLPTLGPRKLKTIKRADIEALRTAVRDKAIKGRGKTGIRTANKVLTLVKMVFNHAVDVGYLARSPAKGVKPLPDTTDEKRERVDGAILTAPELHRLFEYCTPRWRLRIMTAALTGLRAGELLGLTWGHVDFANARVRVRRALVRGKLARLKTAHAVRDVPLASQLVAELKRWQLACPPSELDLVFPTNEGCPESPSNLINRGLYPALRRAGLRAIRIHDLRHCYASLLIDAGEPLLVVSRLLGHSGIRITADTYGHLMPDTVEGVGQRLGDRIFGASEVRDEDGNFLDTFSDSAEECSEESAEVVDLTGGPCWIRTNDHRIKSRTIYAFLLHATLSYSAQVTDSAARPGTSRSVPMCGYVPFGVSQCTEFARNDHRNSTPLVRDVALRRNTCYGPVTT